MRVTEAIAGYVIDLSGVRDDYGTPTEADGIVMDFEYALVLADSEPAPEDPTRPGVPAVMLYTDQGNYKLPADYDVPFINADGVEPDEEDSE